MKSTRRHFLKITGLATGGIVSGLPSLAQIFDFIPSAEQTFIPVIGIMANPSSILDKGVHLRWTLPPSKGIADLIKIYRRKSDANSSILKINPADSNDTKLPFTFRALKFEGSRNSFTLTETSEGKCYQVKPIEPSKNIVITFSENITSCVIHVGDIKKSEIVAFHPDNSISHVISTENQSGKSSIQISAKNGRPFKSIQIPLNFTYLYSIEFTGNQYLCESRGWDLIGKIDNNDDLTKRKLFKRISISTRNFYVKTSNDRERYKKIAEQYEGLMTIMRSPSEAYFQKNADYQNVTEIPFDKLNLKSTNTNSSRLNAYNIFMIGCIDPNIATLAGLYFVDTEANDPNAVYDYKIEAIYNNTYFQKTLCGVVLNVGGKYSETPILKEPLITTQFDSTRWEFDNEFKAKHLGKVRIGWKEANQNPLGLNWKKYIEPVVYILQVDNNKPRIISPREDDANLFFVDQNAILEDRYKVYQVTGIDIFGQQSNDIKSKIKLKDRDTPACPVRLNFNQANNKTSLNFEYGGFQFLTDPEINTLDVFIKNDSIYNQNFKIKYRSFEEEENNANGNKQIRLYFDIPIITTTAFKTLHFVEYFSGKKLPADKRKKFNVVEQSENNVLIVLENEDNYLPEINGTLLLEADARDKKNGWTKLNNSPLNVQQPSETRLTNYNHFVEGTSDSSHFTSAQRMDGENSFKARITKVQFKRHSDNKDLFEGNNNYENDRFTEVTINRTLNESDIFSGGWLKQGQTTLAIIAQNAGYKTPASELLETKIILNGHVQLTLGEASLIPQTIETTREGYIHGIMIFWLQDLNEYENIHTGEFLLKGTKAFTENENGQTITNEEPINVIATVLSDIYKYNERIQVIVRVSSKISYLHRERTSEKSNKMLFFKPYTYDVTETIDNNLLQPNDAFKNIYFAVNAIDKESNESSLSVIAQFIKTRSKNEKPPTPPKPFPCSSSNASEVYLKLPNSEGISYFNLCWNGNENYRYEVGRASDKSIVACHRDLWLKGLSYTTDNESAITINNFLTIGSFDSQNGTVEISILSSNIPQPVKYIGGRLSQGFGATKKYFEIIKSSSIDNQVKLLLRPLIKGNVPTQTTFTINKLPDYPSILENNDTIILLANLTPPIVPTPENPYLPDSLGAFSVVTGQPLRNENSYIDELPGMGNSRFFYKIRAVDSSENRSLWSEASVPAWQVDTRAPEKIENLQIQKIDDNIYLNWKNNRDKNVLHYNIYKTNETGSNLIDQLYITPNNAQTKLNYKPIRIKNKEIDLAFIKDIVPFISSNNTDGIIGVYEYFKETNSFGTTNYVTYNLTSINTNVISNINPMLENNSEVVITTLSNKVFTISFNKIKNKKIRVNNQKIYLGYPYVIENILGIYKMDEFDYNIIPLNNQTGINYLSNNTTYNQNLCCIENLNNLEEGTEVIVIVRGYKTTTLFINSENPILYTNNSIQIDEITIDTSTKVIGIFKSIEYDKNKMFEEQCCYNYAITAISTIEGFILKDLLTPRLGITQFAIKYINNNIELILNHNKEEFEHIILLEDKDAFDLKYLVRAVKTIENISSNPIYIEQIN
jgi:hypothetical protein